MRIVSQFINYAKPKQRVQARRGNRLRKFSAFRFPSLRAAAKTIKSFLRRLSCFCLDCRVALLIATTKRLGFRKVLIYSQMVFCESWNMVEHTLIFAANNPDMQTDRQWDWFYRADHGCHVYCVL